MNLSNTQSNVLPHEHEIADVNGLQDAISSAVGGSVSDVAYATSWNGVTSVAPSKNAVYDKISAMDTTIGGKQDTISDLATIRSGAALGATALQSSAISNTAYATSWNNDTTHAPSKDAVYDKIESVISSVPTNTNQLTNGAGFITNTVSNLSNYYTKTQTYTKSEVDNLITSFGGFEVVSTLPSSGQKTNVIYLLGPIGSGTDKYQEWIYTTEWVMIGDTSVDLTNYATKTQLTQGLEAVNDELENNYMTSTAITTAITNAVTPVSTAKQDKATSGSGAPTSKPSYIGQHYVDTVNSKLYIAKGTSSSADWFVVSGGAGGEGNVVAVTQSEYDALSASEKADGTFRLITDAPEYNVGYNITMSSDSPVQSIKVWVGTTAQYEALESYDASTLYISADNIAGLNTLNTASLKTKSLLKASKLVNVIEEKEPIGANEDESVRMSYEEIEALAKATRIEMGLEEETTEEVLDKEEILGKEESLDVVKKEEATE